MLQSHGNSNFFIASKPITFFMALKFPDLPVMIWSCCFSQRLIAFLVCFWTPLFAAGVFQVGRIKWCVWGAKIVLCERGRYLVRAAALCGDLINRNSLRLLSRPWPAHLGGQINFLLPSVITAEMSCKICCIFLHSFLSVNYFYLVQNSLLFCLCSFFVSPCT